MKIAFLLIVLSYASFFNAQVPVETAIYGQYTNLCVATNCAQAFIGQSTGMLACDLTSGEVTNFDPQNSGLNGTIDDIRIDSIGNIWAIGSEGVYKISGENIEHIQLLDENFLALAIPYLKKICIDKYGRFFLLNSFGNIYQLNPETGVCKKIPEIQCQNGFAIAQSRNGLVYAAGISNHIATLYQISEVPIIISEVDISSVENQTISNFIVDDNSNVWISFLPEYSSGKDEYIAEDGGLVVYSAGIWTVISADMFESLTTLRGFNVRSIDDTEKAIVIYTNTNGQQEYISCIIDDVSHIAHIEDRNIQKPYPSLVTRDSYDREVYFSGSLAYVVEQGKVLCIKADRPSVSSGRMQTDEINNIWIANDGSLTKLQPNREFDLYDYNGIVSGDYFLRQMEIDARNNVWLLSTNELLEFNGSIYTNHDRAWMNMDTCSNSFLSFQIDINEDMWLLCDKFIMHRPLDQNWEKVAIPFSNIEETALQMECSAGNICVLSQNSAYKYDGSNWTIYDTSNSPIELLQYSGCIASDYFGGFYIGGKNAFYHLSDTGLIKLRPIEVSGIEVDQNTGIVWYSYDGGIWRFTPPENFEQLQIFPLLSSSATKTIDNNSNLILNSRGTIYLYNQSGVVGFAQPEFIPPMQLSSDFCSENRNSTSKLTIFPNPAVENIQFYFEHELSGSYQVLIYNMQGEKVDMGQGDASFVGGTVSSISIKNLSKGTYVVHLFMEGFSASATFVKL